VAPEWANGEIVRERKESGWWEVERRKREGKGRFSGKLKTVKNPREITRERSRILRTIRALGSCLTA
jgi:hypothetical protein